MAASIRIRIKVQFLDNAFNETIDPFWLHVSPQQYPFISDIGKRILLICADLIASKEEDLSLSNDDGDDLCDGESKSRRRRASCGISKVEPRLSACQLWLDGCRLLDSERAEILRDNDSVTVKFSESRAGRIATHSRVISSKVKRKDGDEADNKVSVSKDNPSGKRKRTQTFRSEKFEEEELSESEREEQRLRKKRKSNKDSKMNVRNLEDEDHAGKSSHKKTKKKGEKESKGLSDEDLFKMLHDQVEKKKQVLMSMDSIQASSDGSSDLKSDDGDDDTKVSFKKGKGKKDKNENRNSGKGKKKKNDNGHEESSGLQSGKGGNTVNSIDLSLNTKLPENGSNASQNDKDEVMLDISTETKKRRRRRKSKRKKELEEVPKLLRVEDKPRSSTLKLPWDQRPQNNKITFDSGRSSEDEVAEEDKTLGIHDTENKNEMAEHNKTSEEQQVLNSNTINANGNNNTINNGSISHKSLKSDHEELSKKPLGNSFLSNKSRKKFLLRSTVGILETLRSSSPSVADAAVGKACLPTVSKSPFNKSNFASNTNAPVTKSRNSSVFDSPVGESGSGYKSVSSTPIGKSRSTSVFDMLVRDSSSIPPTEVPVEKSRGSSIFDTPARNKNSPALLPSIAKLNDLLQRKKLSNSSCTISTTQNGITVCSRNKSPGWTSHKEAFANPETDVLTNKSTIKTFNGGDIMCPSVPEPTHSLLPKKLLNGAGVKSTPNADVDAVACGLKDDGGCDKVEVIPFDVGSCPPLSGTPHVRDILAYKILEISDDYTPVVSEFKTGKVLSFEGGVVTLELFGQSAPQKKSGKFELIYDNEEEEEEAARQSQDDDQVCVELISMMDTRLVQREVQD